MATWDLDYIETKFRDLIGMPDTNQLSQATAWALINDYYQEQFPIDSDLPEFKQIYTDVITTVEDTESYSVPDSIIKVMEPITLFDSDGDYLDELTFYRDQQLFYADYPRNPDADTGQPASILLFGLYFYLRPIPDEDDSTVDMAVVRKPTTALSTGASVPLSNAWGPAIAHGAALRKLNDIGDEAAIARVAGPFQYHINLLTAKQIMRNVGARTVPGF